MLNLNVEDKGDLILMKTILKIFSDKEISDVHALLFNDVLEQQEIQTIEIFFIKLARNTELSLFDSIVEFCKIYEIHIEQILPTLRKTNLLSSIKAERKKEKVDKSILMLFL